ncbi:MAG TPA: class I SAM-dependent methyltransferase [Bryobacteraceae bacterium]|nr:class I SAM-dependent methyltransferase [Bryobacteraceae bacterium]
MGIFDWLRKQPRKASTAELRAFFNEAASSEEHYPSTIDPRIFHVKLVLEHLGDLSGKQVADVGCGKGRFARIIRERYPSARICALDIAEAMLERVPAGIDRAAATMTELPISTGSCDGAYATESLEHAVDIPKAVAELCRIVKPGGRIVIIDKDVKAWGRLETPAWERWFGRAELEGLLGKHCTAVSSRPISYWEEVEPDGLFLAWLAVK